MAPNLTFEFCHIFRMVKLYASDIIQRTTGRNGHNFVMRMYHFLRRGPVFCLLLRVSSDYAQPITGQVTEVTCRMICRAELTLSKRQKTGHGYVFKSNGGKSFSGRSRGIFPTLLYCYFWFQFIQHRKKFFAVIYLYVDEILNAKKFFQCWKSPSNHSGVIMGHVSQQPLLGVGLLMGKTDGGVPLAAENWTLKDRGKNGIWGQKDRFL